MRRPIKWTLITVIFLGLVFVVGGIGLHQQNKTAVATVASAPQKGYRMPQFSVAEYPGNKTINTNGLIGKPIFINFWASWCPPCQMETPDIVKAYKQFGDKVVFLSVNMTSQDKMDSMEQFVKHYGITWPVALDKTGSVMQKYNIVGFPTSIFVNRQGIITDVNVGLITAENLNSQLKGLLK